MLENTIHWTVLMASETRSTAELRRMSSEKMDASHSATMALLTGQGGAAAITPYVEAATVNAIRLRD